VPADTGGDVAVGSARSPTSSGAPTDGFEPVGGSVLPSGTPSPSTATELVVDVVGRVAKPGVLTLPAGSRIVDAIAAAGGALPHTDLTALDLARKLSDGQEIFVGIPPPSGAAAASAGGVVGDDTAAGVETLPLFVKPGSIVPMGPFLQYSSEKPADPIELRIYRGANGKFTLNGKTYHLPVNNGPNTLHGGTNAWNKQVWSPKTTLTSKGASLQLTYTSPDGQDGFPGTVVAKVTFTLGASNALAIHYDATTDKPTVINLTNHTYFNLGGEASGTVYNQGLMLNADKYTPTDDTQIPTGKIVPVADTDWRSVPRAAPTNE